MSATCGTQSALAMLHDHLQEHSPAIKRFVAAEREACAARVDELACAHETKATQPLSGPPIQQGARNAVMELVAMEACFRAAAALRARGPVLPPLPPWRYKEEAETLRLALERIVGAYDADRESIMFPVGCSAVLAVRELLRPPQ